MELIFSLLQSFMADVPSELVILTEIGIMIIIATFLAFLVRISKQPLIPAYILTGIIIGPFFLGLISDMDLIASLSQIGVAFLIFTAGLEIKFKKLREVGKVASIGGIVQVVVMFLLAFGVAVGLGFVDKAPIYIGLVVAFSSTMIVVTLLSERRELNSLHGRIIIGILLVQDIAAIIALAILSSDFSWSSIGAVLVKAFIFGLIAVILSKGVNPFFRRAADNRELLLLVSISFLFLFVIGAFVTDLSLVIGAFFAGVALANSDYKTEIQGNITSLREFFAVIFFITLGMQLMWITKDFLILLLFLLGLVLIIKPLLLMYIVRIGGFKKRTAFLTGNALAQTSEFALVIVTLGFGLGHIGPGLFSTLVLLTIITMTFTTYLITYEKRLVNWFSWPLNILDHLKTKKEELEYLDVNQKRTIIFGCHRMGSLILKEFEKDKEDLLVVDYNPEIIKSLMEKKVPCIYGDFMHEEILEKINLKSAEIVVSSIPDFEDNLLLIRKTKKINKKAVVIVVASRISEARDLYNEGADYVILPKLIAGTKATELVKMAKKSKGALSQMKKGHKKYLEDIHHLLY
jgi:Kef-type K+ transport system membrane component KefB